MSFIQFVTELKNKNRAPSYFNEELNAKIVSLYLALGFGKNVQRKDMDTRIYEQIKDYSYKRYNMFSNPWQTL